MDLRQLQFFVAVVEERSFTKAAERLHLAQPGVSARIRQLERELGHPLLDRTGRTVTPTEVGEAVLPYARAALEAAENARHAADAFTGLLRGHVAVGLVSGATGQFDIASVLADFHSEHPRVDITLTEDTSERMLQALRRGELDFGVLGLADEHPPEGTTAEIVIDEPVVVAVAPGDPLLARGDGAVPVAALRDRALISLPRGTGLRGVLERACAEAGFRPRVAFEAAAPPLLAGLAARGLGAAVVPAMPPGTAAALGLRTLRLTPQPRARIGLTWRTGGPAGPAARALLSRLRAALDAPRRGDACEVSGEWGA
ncbi:LysR family transcriptional regulator [Streptomyces oryzae]|uniref:LysR family transcriptional regulator n=1 Tax=Streptomyces oryzae TaxID=1434886 RepID=A0ABS3XDH1_9ACTN|nr:LysR family transcriptional regulator [Streptomyces oryzae]MBO8193329.1 LysR family transcriptional regulator [Streptomyces oryzae]